MSMTRWRTYPMTKRVIPHATLLSFLTQLEASYRDVPYHNRNHAADVMQASVFMLNSLRRGVEHTGNTAALS